MDRGFRFYAGWGLGAIAAVFLGVVLSVTAVRVYDQNEAAKKEAQEKQDYTDYAQCVIKKAQDLAEWKDVKTIDQGECARRWPKVARQLREDYNNSR